MNVLSLFDGMSCGNVALERAGYSPNLYFAAEIDKYAIKVAQKNYPKTIQLGDVVNVRKMAEAGIFGHIDLLIGGSPCQGFSFAGKQLAFDDPRSQLFFEYLYTLQALRKTNPNIKFLLENMKMKKQHLDVITGFLGVQPILINSSLVSAQNRQRYYWCNWKVEQPEDKGIYLKDIIQWDITEPNSPSWHEWWDKNKEFQLKKKYSAIAQEKDKAITMTARQYASYNGNFVELTNFSSSGRGDGKVESRITDADKAACLTKTGYTNRSFTGVYIKDSFRNLTPIECERLQTLPDNYTEGVSNSQRYKMLGNGFTVDIISHILSCNDWN